MRKTKFEQRVENAFDAFPRNEDFTDDKLSYAGHSALLKAEEISDFTQKADNYFALFKKIFLFLPGVLILHLASFATIYFYGDFGVTPWMLFWFASGIFMTWAGIGDLKNKKHSLIPASVIISAMTLAIAGYFLSPHSFEYSFYAFPLLFIVPILVKKLIAEPDADKSGS